MIFDQMTRFVAYAQLAPAVIEELAAFFGKLSADTPAGKYEIDGKKVYAIVQRYQTHPADFDKVETHHEYADIQLLLAGEETILYRPVDGLAVTSPYSEEHDFAFYRHDGKNAMPVPLVPGNFAVFFPGEGHMPGIGDPDATVVKVVVKIHRSLLAA